MAEINIPIAPRSHELIRNRVAEILASELFNQAAITYDDLFLAKVFVQRSKPVDVDECPVINVSLSTAVIDNHTAIDSDVEFPVFIDVFATADYTDGLRGDTLASFEAQRLAGVIQGILLNPVFCRLGFAPPFIMRSKVTAFETGLIDRNENTNLAYVRTTLTVRASQVETGQDPITNYDLSTQVFLGETEQGYLYSGTVSPMPPPTCAPAMVLDSLGNLLATINSGGSGIISNSTAVLKDADGNVLETKSILAQGSEDLVAPNASYAVEYQNGTPIQSGEILAGGSEIIQVPNPIVCADAIVNINSVFWANVPSGGTENIIVRQSSGSTQVGSIQGQYFRIADSTAVLKTTSNVTLSTTSIKAEDSEDIVAPDTSIEVNGVAEGSVVAGLTVDIQLSDSLGVVTPLSVTQTGNDFAVVLPTTVCPPAVTRSTATLMKTGQTTPYRTGDDGDIEAGRASDFLTLDAAPVHNDGSATINTTTNRFTDTLGGSTYANDWVLDWSTWNGSTLLGYFRVFQANATWDTAIDNSLGTFGGFANCRMSNLNEIQNIQRVSAVGTFSYSPFSLGGGATIWTSTTNPNNTAFVFTLSSTVPTVGVTGKTSSVRSLVVRTFSLSTLNVLS
jgi:hypothetical protein